MKRHKNATNLLFYFPEDLVSAYRANPKIYARQTLMKNAVCGSAVGAKDVKLTGMEWAVYLPFR